MSSNNHKAILIHPGSFVNKKTLLSLTSLRFRPSVYLLGILLTISHSILLAMAFDGSFKASDCVERSLESASRGV